MKQIDQDPGSYRVQGSDGSWQHRVNKPMARVMAVLGAVMVGYLWWASAGEGVNALLVPIVGGVAFFAGAAFTMSLKSLNW